MNAAEAACGIVSQREIFEGQAPRGNDDRHWTMCPRKDISSFQIASHKKAPRSNRQKEQLTLGVTQMFGYRLEAPTPIATARSRFGKLHAISQALAFVMYQNGEE
jgi:hypothetical protein